VHGNIYTGHNICTTWHIYSPKPHLQNHHHLAPVPRGGVFGLGRTVSGPELSEKRKIFEVKFKVPEMEQLSETGWQQAFYKRLSISLDLLPG